MSIFRLGFNNARSSAAAPYIILTVASEGQTRRKLAEKAELASANEHFSASLQRRMAERSRSGGTLALSLDDIGQLRYPAEQSPQRIQTWDLDGQRHLRRAVFLV